MANIKLFGLVLIITTSILALAAIATQTDRIRIRRFGTDPSTDNTGGYPNFPSPPNNGWQGNGDSGYTSYPTQGNERVPNQLFDQPNGSNSPVQFINIPIILPLSVAGLLGLMFWFTPIPAKSTKYPGSRKNRGRR